MKQFLIMIALLLGAIAQPASAQSVKQKVAVYMTGDESQDSYKKVIGAKLVSAITANDKYAAVERTADFLAALASEQDYQISGEVRDSQIAKLGQRFGVKFVVVADVSEIFEELFISARMINVETGLVEKSCDANGQAANMSQLIALSNKVAKELLRDKEEEARLVKEAQILDEEYRAKQALEAKFSQDPINLSLCVRRNGEIRYISGTDWNSLSSIEKSQCTKIGLCLKNYINNEYFLLALQDSPSCNGYNLGDLSTLPNKWESYTLYSEWVNINMALATFGGQQLSGDYWKNEKHYIRNKKNRKKYGDYYYYLFSADHTYKKGYLNEIHKVRRKIISF